MTLYSIGIVAKHYGVSPSTIRRWAEKGLLAVACRTFGSHRRFHLQLNPVASGVERKHLGYARVSSHDQKEDLLRQAERLKQPVARKSSPTSAPVLTATSPVSGHFSTAS